MRTFSRVLLTVLAMLFAVVAEHRGFVVPFLTAVALLIITFIPADRYPKGSKWVGESSAVVLLWTVLLISFGWAANDWARSGKTAKPLFSVGDVVPKLELVDGLALGHHSVFI